MRDETAAGPGSTGWGRRSRPAPGTTDRGTPATGRSEGGTRTPVHGPSRADGLLIGTPDSARSLIVNGTTFELRRDQTTTYERLGH